MPVKNVDIVFVIDASDSMKPCIQGVLNNISKMLEELEKAKFNVNLCGIVHCVPGEHIYTTYSLINGKSIIQNLYKKEIINREDFFTSNLQQYSQKLNEIEVEGDEDMLLALDCALDLPYREIFETRRGVVLLSDEPFETNYNYNNVKNIKIAETIVDKIEARNIELYLVMPESEIGNILAEARKSTYTQLENGCDGLAGFDFSNFFTMLGKTLSVSTMQLSKEKPYEKGIMGQKDFGVASSEFKHIGDSANK